MKTLERPSVRTQKVIICSELRHITNLDELLTKDLDYCIVLYDSKPDRGHWAALSKYNGVNEHFDPMALSPTRRLNGST